MDCLMLIDSCYFSLCFYASLFLNAVLDGYSTYSTHVSNHMDENGQLFGAVVELYVGQTGHVGTRVMR